MIVFRVRISTHMTIFHVKKFEMKHGGLVSDRSLVLCSLQMFHRCQRAVTGLHSRCGHCTEQEERLLRNVVSSLAQSLQDLSTNFRHTQSSYLKRKIALSKFSLLAVVSHLFLPLSRLYIISYIFYPQVVL